MRLSTRPRKPKPKPRPQVVPGWWESPESRVEIDVRLRGLLTLMRDLQLCVVAAGSDEIHRTREILAGRVNEAIAELEALKAEVKKATVAIEAYRALSMGDLIRLTDQLNEMDTHEEHMRVAQRHQFALLKRNQQRATRRAKQAAQRLKKRGGAPPARPPADTLH